MPRRRASVEAGALAVRAAEAFGELRTVDWDVAVTDHGPVVVEGYAGAWPQPISSVPKLPKPGLADNQWSE